MATLENKIRNWLSHHPFIYALYGGVGIVLFWRGVWHGVDVFGQYYFLPADTATTIDLVSSAWDAVASLIFGTIILASSGLFVSELIGKEIIISGLRGEKRLTERTETEVRTETGALAEVLERLDNITVRLENIEANHHNGKK